MGQYVRYLLPVFPIYLVASALGLKLFLDKHCKYKKMLAFTGALTVVFLFSILVYHFRYQYKPLLGMQSHQSYLENMERTYLVADWMNRELPQNAKILSLDEFRLFYFDHEIIRQVMLERYSEYPQSGNTSDIIQFLKSIGITHVLAAEKAGSDIWTNSILSDVKWARKLTTIESKNLREGKYRYSVYELSA